MLVFSQPGFSSSSPKGAAWPIGGSPSKSAPSVRRNTPSTNTSSNTKDTSKDDSKFTEANIRINEELDKGVNTNKSLKRSIIFNYSYLVMTDSMFNLLNRAFNFAVLPLKLDLTEVLVDFNRFARAAIWQEYWHGRDKNDDYVKSIFNIRKNTLPKNHTTPKFYRQC